MEEDQSLPKEMNSMDARIEKEPETMSSTETSTSSVGPIIGSIIIIIILILGGLYFWGQKIVQTEQIDATATTPLEQADTQPEI